jgi:hypothetical protein
MNKNELHTRKSEGRLKTEVSDNPCVGATNLIWEKGLSRSPQFRQREGRAGSSSMPLQTTGSKTVANLFGPPRSMSDGTLRLCATKSRRFVPRKTVAAVGLGHSGEEKKPESGVRRVRTLAHHRIKPGELTDIVLFFWMEVGKLSNIFSPLHFYLGMG